MINNGLQIIEISPYHQVYYLQVYRVFFCKLQIPRLNINYIYPRWKPTQALNHIKFKGQAISVIRFLLIPILDKKKIKDKKNLRKYAANSAECN